jgi:DNA mismatch repair protein MutS
MNDVEGRILGLVARLHPEVFGRLDDYCERHGDYLDPTIARFDREAQFYLGYLAHVRRLSKSGLAFCYPSVTDEVKDIHARETFDIALANKLVPERGDVVPNDFELGGPERIIVVTGPNQGGKTTFARMFGQLHHLAAIGVLVPGKAAQLYLCDELFTHFEREEDITSLAGKLEDDLRRIHGILERATADSIVVMNESFTSTTLNDALVLGQSVMEELIERDVLGVYVTFVDELSRLGDSTVSMVSQIDPDEPATRTYKILRQPANGLAYAEAIAAKYRLTYERLSERLDR